MFAPFISPATAGFLIQQSSRFNADDSAYLYRTPSTAGNRKTWTFSCWVKRANIGLFTPIFGVVNGASDYNLLYIDSDNQLAFGLYESSTNRGQKDSTALFRDPSAWYHIVLAYDSTDAIAADRIKLWVNGTRIVDFDSSTNPDLNHDSYINGTNQHRIGQYNTSYFDGLIALPILVDGAALDYTSFAEFDGIWYSPKRFIASNASGETGDQIPTMTAASTPSGTASASSEDSAGEAAWKAFDGTTGKWQSSATPGWIQYDFGSGNSATPTAYYMTMSSSGAEAGRFPEEWTLEASNTGSFGGEETILDTQTSVSWSTGETKKFSFSNSTAYRYWRWVVTANASESKTNIQEIELVENQTGYGANGFVLDFADTGAYGGDTSGNGNDFTASGLASNDQLADVPTDNAGRNIGNLCTGNPLWKGSGVTLSNGNRTWSISSTTGNTHQSQVTGTLRIYESGDWFWRYEFVSVSAGTVYLGICRPTRNMSTSPYSGGEIRVYAGNGNKHNGTSETSYGDTYTTGDFIGVHFNATTGDLTFYKNETSQGVAFSGLTGEWVPFAAHGSSNQTAVINAIFEPSDDWPAGLPTTAKALGTQNLPAPTISNPGEHFNTVLYTGNGSTQSITGVGFQPDLVWLKGRDNTWDNELFDAVRGATKYIESNTTNAEATDATGLTTFDSDGFSIGSGTALNSNTEDYVAWCWKANGSGVSNSDGSITSTVSANTTAGFSIVKYTGTGSAATVGHGLVQAPKFVIVKDLDNSRSWNVHHIGLTSAAYTIYLDQTAAQASDSTIWNSTAPSSSVVSVGTGNGSNGSAIDYVMYCWSEVEGFSKFGSYTGNGSADGPFVYTGFKPAFLLIKRTNTTGDWELVDAARDTYNPVTKGQRPNSSIADFTGTSKDFCANGFKLRGTGTSTNASGSTYIYAAFAESPFQGGSKTITQGRAA